ncbi:MAG: NAD(P)-binding domain-containing protein [Ferruginibacter sp.]
MSKKIAIIGGGNLGTAIAEGLLKKQICKSCRHYYYQKKYQYIKNPER